MIIYTSTATAPDSAYASPFQRTILTSAYALFILLFWSLRVYYWQVTEEAPFSDMADYVALGLRFAKDFDFLGTGFWAGYKPPTVPVMMGLVFALAGKADIAAWRLFQAMFVFATLAWMLYEVYRATDRRHGPALIIGFAVALSQPSIFWSLKAATESPAEGFLYLLIAACLCAWRKPTAAMHVLLGALFILAILCRPVFAPCIGVYGLALLWRLHKERRPLLGVIRPAGWMLLGFLVAWSPWLIRTTMHYGAPVPVSTQGPYSFLWELGEINLRHADGSTEPATISTLQRDAPQRFANDREAARHAQLFVDQWLADNWRIYPKLLAKRLITQLVERDVHLTKVPRDRLMGNRLDRLLIDKTPVFVGLGILGLLVIAWTAQPLAYFLFAMPLLVWLFSALFLSYARMMEPLLPLFLAGNGLLLYTLAMLIPWPAPGRKEIS